jgi:hypothetical protein
LCKYRIEYSGPRNLDSSLSCDVPDGRVKNEREKEAQNT